MEDDQGDAVHWCGAEVELYTSLLILSYEELCFEIHICKMLCSPRTGVTRMSGDEANGHSGFVWRVVGHKLPNDRTVSRSQVCTSHIHTMFVS